MGEDLRTRLGESLWTLVASVGTPLVRAEEITVVPAGGMRKTYRLWFDNGRTLKGRRFRTAARAEVAWRILARAAAPYLGRAVSHEGDAMLEEWVDGEALVQGHVDHRLVRAAGRMLGMLHSCPPPPVNDIDFQPLDGPGWVRKTRDNLRALRERGLVTAEHADLLHGLAMSHLPATVPLGIVHRDLCPENLIAVTGGRLMSVDNGSVTIGALDEDLCRVWYRWPMTADERATFLEGYREFRDVDGFGRPSPFWAIVVIVNSARARLGLSATDAAAALQRLDRFFSEQGFGGWTGPFWEPA